MMRASSSSQIMQKAILSTEGQLVRKRSTLQQETDIYSYYETGLDKLLKHVSKNDSYYYDLLGYQQQLCENIRYIRRHRDTDTRKAERSEIIDQLNKIAITKLGISFNKLCEASIGQELVERVEEIEAASEEMLPSFQLEHIHITGRFADNVAILHIYSYGADKYCMMLKNSILTELDTEPINRPDLSLGQFSLEVQDADTAVSIKQTVLFMEQMSRSRSIRNVLRSLAKLRKLFPEDVYLVIADFTNFEIPWEMLKLPAVLDSPNLEPGYLGALITVSRWQCIIDDEYSEVSLTIGHEECIGNLMTYINEDHEEPRKDLAFLPRLNTVSHSDIREFQKHLRQDEANYAMIYLACQGFFSKDFYGILLGSHTNEQQRISLAELYDARELGLLRKSHTIVFINASYSGRFHHSKYTYDERLQGFAELFLGKGARGVIGILGAVSNEHASVIGHMLLEEIYYSPQRPVATLLRDIRAGIVKSLPPVNEMNDLHDLQRLVSAFKYVYYGNPMTVLRLSKGEGSSDV